MPPRAGRKTMVEVRQVTKRYQAQGRRQAGGAATQALDGVSFAVAEGEFVGIMGAVGVGQIDPAQLPGDDRCAHERLDRDRRRGHHAPRRQAARTVPPRRPGVHLPGLQPARYAHGVREHRARAHDPESARARDRRARQCGGAPARHPRGARQLPLPALRRPASARRGGARDHHAPQARARRRADRRARLQIGPPAPRVARPCSTAPARRSSW